MKMLKILVILTLLVFSLPSFYLIAQETDTVSSLSADAKTPQEDTGEITSETYDGVDIKIKGSTIKKIKLDLIKNITYRDEPRDYINAKQLQESGKYTQAVESYKKALNDTRLRAIFKQHILYNVAVCYQQANQFNDAIQAYDELLKAFEKTRYFKQAYFNKSQCAATTDLKRALDTLDDARVKGRDIGEKFLLEVDLRKANLLEDNNKLDEAKAIYNQLKTKAAMQPSILYRALIGLGRVELANKNPSGAEDAFNEVIEKSDDVVAKAGAYNGKGDCIIASTKTPDYKTYKNALFAYLRSKLLYPAPAGEPTVEEERAIYNAGLSCEKLAQALPQEKKKVYINNAKLLYQELKQKFPGSKFVPEANKRLSELGK